MAAKVKAKAAKVTVAPPVSARTPVEVKAEAPALTAAGRLLASATIVRKMAT